MTEKLSRRNFFKLLLLVGGTSFLPACNKTEDVAYEVELGKILAKPEEYLGQTLITNGILERVGERKIWLSCPFPVIRRFWQSEIVYIWRMSIDNSSIEYFVDEDYNPNFIAEQLNKGVDVTGKMVEIRDKDRGIRMALKAIPRIEPMRGNLWS